MEAYPIQNILLKQPVKDLKYKRKNENIPAAQLPGFAGVLVHIPTGTNSGFQTEWKFW